MGDVWGNDLLKSAKSKPKSFVQQPKLTHSKIALLCTARKLQRRFTPVDLPSQEIVNIQNGSASETKENAFPGVQLSNKSMSNVLDGLETQENVDSSLSFKSPSKKHCKVSKPLRDARLLNRRELQISAIFGDDVFSSASVESSCAHMQNIPPVSQITEATNSETNFCTGSKVVDTTGVSQIDDPGNTLSCSAAAEQISLIGPYTVNFVPATETRPNNSANAVANCSEETGKARVKQSNYGARETSVAAKTRGMVSKSGNFVKLNMKKKNFCRKNGQFSVNRKRFKHKQYQRARSWKENFEMRKLEKTTDTVDNSDQHCSNSYEKPKMLENLNLILNKQRKFDGVMPHDFEKGVFSMTKKEILSFVPEALRVFKIKAFLQWQLDCMLQTLTGNSSIIVKPTGSGKSICYLLPAWILYKKFSCVTLIVSPLISLMDDQTKACPRALRAAAFHSALADSKRNAILKSLQDGNIGALFVSPESIVEGSLLRQIAQLPRISFACIDEVHCISEWSHNFRPSYFRLCSVLKDCWGIETFLGITATASRKSLNQIAELLNVQEPSLFYDVTIPSNLQITASCDTHRLQALMDLLQTEPFKDFSSILIYCTKRVDCDMVASHIRTVLACQEVADSYHAGKSSADRARVQKNFMCEKLKIVAATVAFGMGLNKPGLPAVIHYNISGSVESFVQEIGRAGRNTDKVACCHTFLSPNSNFDLFEQERHIFSSYVEPSTIRKVADLVFGSLDVINCPSDSDCSEHCHFGSVPLSKAADLDIKEEVMMTLISYLESHSNKPLKINRVASDICSAFFYRGYHLPTEFFDEHPVFRTALKLGENNCKYAWTEGNRLKFNLSYVMNYLDAEYHQISSNIFSSQTKNVGIKVDFNTKSVVFKMRCSEIKNKAFYVDHLLDRSKEHERSQLHSLHHLFSNILTPIAQKSVLSCFENAPDFSEQQMISQKISQYFEADPQETTKKEQDQKGGKLKFELNSKDEHLARQTVRSFLALYHDMDLTGLAVCRILQGIDSPQYPAEMWYSVNKFWKSLNNIGFKDLLFICNEEVRINR